MPVSNLVIIVGPNGVGKTTFLRDLYYQFINSTPSSNSTNQDTKWGNILNGDFMYSNKTEWKDWVKKLLEISGHKRNNQSAFAVREYLSHQAGGQFIYEDEKNRLKQYLEDNDPPDFEYLEQTYGRPFKSQHTHLLTVDTRLHLSKDSKGSLQEGTYSNNLKPAPFLALNIPILNRLNKSLRLLFGKQFHVEPHNYPNYSIDVAEAGTQGPKKSSSTTQGLIKNKKYYKEWLSQEDTSTLDTEGHGVRAASEILYALENPRKKILFIDEPELHLYPSTKYNLGNVISNYARQVKQIILTTHDTELLRGLVYNSRDATVLRINSDRQIKSISSRSIGKSYSSDILQASFQDAVVIVEGITDKYVYANAINIKHLADDMSLQFVSMEGKDRLSVPIDFYKKLEIKTAVIADFDILFTEKRGMKDITRILKAKGFGSTVLNSIEQEIDAVKEFMKGRTNKNKGLEANGLSEAEKSSIKSLLNTLAGKGLFIVPIGVLEDWVNLPSNANPEKVLGRYKSASNSKYKPMTDFLKSIIAYIETTD